MITAPYNFVPLSKFVYFPDEPERISHDIPFSDGISGEISCTLVTKTPVYVRNGGNWNHEEVRKNPEAQSFFKVKDTFMIPGTTLKGMLRNVIEIISFGKLNRVDDYRYSVRDLQNPKLYGKHMTDNISGKYRAKPSAAWLTLDRADDQWYLTPCEYARVEQSDLKAYAKIKSLGPDRALAFEKYETWHKAGVNLQVKFDCDMTEVPYPHKKGEITLLYRKSRNIGKGPKTGTIVLTGQPNPRKHMEFIFFGPDAASITSSTTRHPVSPTLRKEFEFIHSNDKLEPNEDWAYWKGKMKRGEPVPVFCLGNTSKPESIGLALMYRLPYKHSVHEVIRNTSPDHFCADPDFAETLFGFAGNPEGLKGRVSITPAVAPQSTLPSSHKVYDVILGTPRPTYYPNYLEQPSVHKGFYKTFMDDDCHVRGWKRYPARPGSDIEVQYSTPEQQNVATKLIPLPEGAEFTFKVKVHNLRPAELGAVIWALTWGGNEKCHHALGMGKSFGWGQVVIRINQDGHLAKITGEALTGADVTQCLHDFIDQMKNKICKDWAETPQMKQLLAMANPDIKPQCAELRHMALAPENQFVAEKKKVGALLPHTPFSGMKDDDRFKAHKQRMANKAQKSESKELPQKTDVKKEAPVAIQEIWEKANLSWNPGNNEITATHVVETNKKAIGGKKEQVPASLQSSLFGKKKFAKGKVVVEKAGNAYIIVKIESEA